MFKTLGWINSIKFSESINIGWYASAQGAQVGEAGQDRALELQPAGVDGLRARLPRLRALLGLRLRHVCIAVDLAASTPIIASEYSWRAAYHSQKLIFHHFSISRRYRVTSAPLNTQKFSKIPSNCLNSINLRILWNFGNLAAKMWLSLQQHLKYR